ncbi:MAG: outer membrane protein transport protein [Tannerellaceae bacterium]|nr:outer membrane protein transport protein [Tannerellaceae bacterium]
MLKISRVIVAGILVLSQFSVVAQNNTNSPYTRYGYGELADRSFGAGRAMGGVGIGLRSSKQINPMNPASYTSIDSMTFIFDFGVAGQLSWFNDGINSQSNINGNVEYIALQFPITKRIAFSAGILPYSYVGYSYGSVLTDNDVERVESFSGKGGLNDLYAGLSIEVWKKRLSVGANFGYFFGSITHSQDVYVYPFTTSVSERRDQTVDIRDFKMDFGIQYTHPISKTESFTIGATFSPSKKLNTETTTNTYQYVSSISSGVLTKGDTINTKTYDLPNSIGVGVSYEKRDKLLLAADFLYEDWSNARFAGSKDDFKNRIRTAAGVEYIPDHFNRSFVKRIRYRAGVHYSNSYLKIQEKSYNEYGASIGFGLPLLDNRSLINLSFEYVNINPDKGTLSSGGIVDR